ncbi:MAG TPA: ABC transporter substrate-binding protein, partial [Thermoleophilia bacterium]|nr:ABC transporter substrate-binding protein [Thermoleophilia bacterium]
WEANADATVWTFHLRDAKFHNGAAVTAADFKYAWERICNPVNESEISYHLSPVKGFAAMQDGTATELEGVKAVDEKTLEVTLDYSFGDFEYVVGHPALAPVPKSEVDKDAKAFAEMPIGNGPFKMAGPWQHDQLIQVVRFDDYWGAKTYADGVDFKIFKDEETAFLEFKAGNLDFTHIPSGQVAATKAEFGESTDGLEVSPGKQALTGPETAIYYIVLNMKDETMNNADLRRALSLAINREAIATTVYEGVRQPATGIVPEGVAGYLDNQWAYAKYDVEQAKQLLEKAGYPNGQGLPEIRIGFNSGAGHEDVMALIQADWKAIGVNSKLEGVEWAQWLDQMDAADFMSGRLGWLADYPIIDNFLYPLFKSDSADNHSFYNNPAIDTALLDARATVDTAGRVAKYQALDKTIGEDAPVIPIVKYRHHHVGSARIMGLVFSPMGLASLESAWIKAAQ